MCFSAAQVPKEQIWFMQDQQLGKDTGVTHGFVYHSKTFLGLMKKISFIFVNDAFNYRNKIQVGK